MPKILVIGSSNTDMVVRADRLPRPGETVLGGTFFMNPGGKGANQAVAAARLGGQVAFVCKTGDDLFGSEARRLFREEGIDTSHLLTDPSAPSGVALITVDRQAENCIVVAPGANANLTPDDLRRAASAFEQADIVLLQLEIPMETVEQAALTACATGKRVVLNPAPATAIPARLLAALDLITPNETEAEAITGIRIADRRTADEAARRLAATGAKQVVITLGAQGALVYEAGQSRIVEGYPVRAVDTTAAGDVFNGALVVALAEGKPLEEAARFACKAAAISVTRPGAQGSIPTRAEVEAFDR
jgi:ribokinase